MSTGVVPERDVLASRLAYLTVGLPTVGTVAAVLYAVFDGLWLSDVLLFVGMYLITALGVEAGLHRYFSHRSFDASEPVKLFLGVAGSMAAQGPIVFWVANHCIHHAYADTDRDPPRSERHQLPTSTSSGSGSPELRRMMTRRRCGTSATIVPNAMISPPIQSHITRVPICTPSVMRSEVGAEMSVR